MIRLTIPSIEEDDLDAVRGVLMTGNLVQGLHVAAFERAVASYVGTREAIAVSNCTAALQMALLACHVGPGDVVLTTAYSFPATGNAIELCGARPVFVDIEPETFNIDPNRLEAALKPLMADQQRAKTVKAILPVHAFGQMADMRSIGELAARYGLPVIEDAACALGATLDGQQAGSWSELGCFSFHPRKAITTGEGGMVVTNNESLALRLRALRNHGMDPKAATPVFIAAGFNYRMTDFQGALGVSQMTKLDRIIAARRRLAAEYTRALSGTPFLAPVAGRGSNPVYQSYVILLPRETATRRETAILDLKKMGIETNLGTWHMPLTDHFRARYGFRAGDFPVTDDVFARTLTLPLHERLSEGELSEVTKQVRQIFAPVEA
jgi:perosamine synthetase